LGNNPLAGNRFTAQPDELETLRSTEARERLAKLYAEYAKFVGWVASRLLAQPDEVEDVVQEVFMIAMTKLDTLIDPPQIRGWLKTVTQRRAMRKIRWARVRARFGLASQQFSQDPVVASPTASPEDRAALVELFGVLEKMPVELRLAWSFRYLSEENVESVAELCGCSLATAKRRIAAAQNRINEELSDG
jgi:RNA polymerase sigma-70 factor (ECF subfamily)